MAVLLHCQLSQNDSPHILANDVDLQFGEAGGIGCAVPLPPKSCSSHKMTSSFTEVTLHPTFRLLLKPMSSYKGARRLFELDLTSFHVSTYFLKNRLPYVHHHNHIFIKCTTFSQGPFKNNTESCLVCFKFDGMTSFKVVMVNGVYYNAITHTGFVSDAVISISELPKQPFLNATSTAVTPHDTVQYEVILSHDNICFTMFFVNKSWVRN